MTKMILIGCNGRMGQMITGLVEKDADIEIVAGIDFIPEQKNQYPVFQDVMQCDVDADVIIDFSSAQEFEKRIDFSAKNNIPIVQCSTGMNDERLAYLKESSKKVAVLKSANMSLGINLIMKLLQEAASKLYQEGFDIEILEKHHNQKLDAPSGTAIALADAVNAGLESPLEYVYDRSTVRQQRKHEEIGFASVRGGTIVGEHEVIFAGTDEVITFQHEAYSRAVFAKGAIAAAKFLKGKEAGFYDMSDVLL